MGLPKGGVSARGVGVCLWGCLPRRRVSAQGVGVCLGGGGVLRTVNILNLATIFGTNEINTKQVTITVYQTVAFYPDEKWLANEFGSFYKVQI